MDTPARGVALALPGTPFPATIPGTRRCHAAHWRCMHTGLRRSARPAACRAYLDSATEELLHSFWQSRGVFDEEERRQLVQIAQQVDRSEGWAPAGSGQLAGIAMARGLAEEGLGSSRATVLEVSARLMQLRDLLGGRDDVDIARMVVREPRLLVASMADLTTRVLELKLTQGLDGVLDVGKLVEAQPALLLQPPVQPDEEETAAERLVAWQHGLMSDGAAEWGRQLAALAAYAQRNGDAHVGHRQGEDQELVRWAAKQRAAWKVSELPEGRLQALVGLGFEFDDETAEWWRWFNELATFQRRAGHCSPAPLADSDTFLLFNWCSVQRIARRSRYLRACRIQVLTDIGFDWTGADPLS